MSMPLLEIRGDELIFDGSSFILDKNGNKILSLKSCQEDLVLWDSEDSKRGEIKIILFNTVCYFRLCILSDNVIVYQSF